MFHAVIFQVGPNTRLASTGIITPSYVMRSGVYYVCTMSRCLSRCSVPTRTRPQSGRVHYMYAAAEASYDRAQSSAVQL